MVTKNRNYNSCLGPNGGSRNCSEPNGAPGFAQPNGGFTAFFSAKRILTSQQSVDPDPIELPIRALWKVHFLTYDRYCLGPNGGSRNCSEPNGAPGFAQPNGGFTGLTVGARELTHRIALCKTFIYIYTILWTVRPYSRCWVRMTSDLWLWLFYPESISVLSSQISLFTHAGVVLGSERRGVALRPDNS
jgi:hypothetical protein